jgi:hypothetical protein
LVVDIHHEESAQIAGARLLRWDVAIVIRLLMFGRFEAEWPMFSTAFGYEREEKPRLCGKISLTDSPTALT